jgi:hypothetical protein
MRRDLRRHRRYAVDAGVVQVYWLDKSGRMKVARTRALNVSEQGIALQLPGAVMPLQVRFQFERFAVAGLGTVQYRRREGPKYVVGFRIHRRLALAPSDGRGAGDPTLRSGIRQLGVAIRLKPS